MTKKILGGILAVCALTLCAALLLFLGFLYNHFTDQIITELEKELVFAKNGVLLKGGEYLSELPSGFARITWIDQDGTVLYDSAVDESLMENHAQREEVLLAQTQRFGKSIRHSATLMQTNIYVATKLQDQTVLRVSSTQQSIWALMLGMLPPLGIVLALAAGLSVLLAVRVSRRIVEPINQIDLEHPNVQDSYRELAPLLNRILTQNAFIARQMDQMHQKQDEFALITDNMHEGFLLLDRT
jgi:two-component system phosphate regulon sensor histidine kinase PhoR